MRPSAPADFQNATLEIRRAEDIAPAFEALKGRVEQPSVAVRVHI